MTSHPAIVIPPECGFICWLQPKYSHWIADDWGKSRNITAFCHDVFHAKKFATWRIAEDELGEHLLRTSPQDYATACACIYELYAAKHAPQATRWGDKNNFYTGHVLLLSTLFHGAFFLQIVRDPRDVACSYKDMSELTSPSAFKPRLPVEAGEIAADWTKNVSRVLNAFSALPRRNCLSIRYEDIVTSPEGTLRKICDWLELPYDSNMMNGHLMNRKYSLEPDEMLAWKANTLEPINSASVGRYSRELSTKEQDTILQQANHLMQLFHYA